MGCCRSRWPIRSDPAHADEVGFASKRDVQVVVADPPKLKRRLTVITARRSRGFSQILKELGSDKEMERAVNEAGAMDDVKQVENLANQAPIVKFVDLVLFQAIQDRASDIHFEPFEDEFRIRYRVDGALYEMAPPPKYLALSVISRIKVMSNLNISERRLPQDGRISYTVANRQVDLRVSTLPTQFGESVVLRVARPRGGQSRPRHAGFPHTCMIMWPR